MFECVCMREFRDEILFRGGRGGGGGGGVGNVKPGEESIFSKKSESIILARTV